MSDFDWGQDEFEFAHTHTRIGDPDTSWEAAEALTTLNKHCRLLLEAFERQSKRFDYQGLHRDEAALYAAINPWAASKRMSDLKNKRFITPMIVNGVVLKRKGDAGVAQVVFDITVRGRDALRK